MKKVIVLVLLSLCLVSVAGADRLNLIVPETLEVPSSDKIDWRIVLIDNKQKKIVVEWQWLSDSGRPISLNGRDTQRWECRDMTIEGTTAECTGNGTPYPCCTGVGTGTCDNDETCFSDVFGFQIRAQDVGEPIGRGLRLLLYNQWRSRNLSGNSGVFE